MELKRLLYYIMTDFTIKRFPKQHDLNILQIQAFYKEETSSFIAVLDHKNQFKFQNTAFLFVAIQIWINFTSEAGKKKTFQLASSFLLLCGLCWSSKADTLSCWI